MFFKTTVSKSMLLTGFLMAFLCIMIGVFIYDGKPKTCDSEVAVKINNFIKELTVVTKNKEITWRASTFSEGYQFNTNYKNVRINLYKFTTNENRVAMHIYFSARNQDKLIYSDEFELLNTLLKNVQLVVDFDMMTKPDEAIKNQFDTLVNSLTMRK